MIINEETWSNIPLLHIVENEFDKKDIPVAIFLHGFTSAKEHNLHYAYHLAKKGIRVLLPDAHLHGVRSEQLDEAELSLRFWEIVITNIEELAVLHQEIKDRGYAESARIGVGGTSMGGITTLGAMKVYDWVDAAIVMMGAPGYVELAKAQIHDFEQKGFKLPVTIEEKQQLFEHLATFDITKHPSALQGRPVYFWHGKNDPIVPFAPTFKFYEQVKNQYLNREEDFVFVTDKRAAHAVTRPGMLEAVDWLATHLNE